MPGALVLLRNPDQSVLDLVFDVSRKEKEEEERNGYLGVLLASPLKNLLRNMRKRYERNALCFRTLRIRMRLRVRGIDTRRYLCRYRFLESTSTIRKRERKRERVLQLKGHRPRARIFRKHRSSRENPKPIHSGSSSPPRSVAMLLRHVGFDEAA